MNLWELNTIQDYLSEIENLVFDIRRSVRSGEGPDTVRALSREIEYQAENIIESARKVSP